MKQFTLVDYYGIMKRNIIIKSDCELFPGFMFEGYIDSVRPAKNHTGTYIIYFKYKDSKANKAGNSTSVYKTIKIDSSMYKLRYRLLY